MKSHVHDETPVELQSTTLPARAITLIVGIDDDDDAGVERQSSPQLPIPLPRGEGMTVGLLAPSRLEHRRGAYHDVTRSPDNDGDSDGDVSSKRGGTVSPFPAGSRRSGRGRSGSRRRDQDDSSESGSRYDPLLPRRNCTPVQLPLGRR